MKEFDNLDQLNEYWEKRGGSTISRKCEYVSRKFPDKKIYTQHGFEYFSPIFHTIRKHFPDLLIELGTLYGGITLAIHEEFPELEIYTFDVSNNSEKSRDLFNQDIVCFMVEDILKNENEALVNLLKANSDKRKILYCDNGNKEDEINVYSKYLSQGDVIGCHDWMFEVSPKNVEKALRNFKPFDREMYLNETYAIHSRFWIKNGEQ